MALNLIRLWKIKADVASGAPFSAEEDLNHLSFDIMAAAAVDIPPNEGSIAQYLEKLQANRSSRVTRNECIEFPSMDIPELFDALLVSERAAGTAIGFPFPRLFHFFNNHFRSKVRWAENFRNSTRTSSALSKGNIKTSSSLCPLALPLHPTFPEGLYLQPPIGGRSGVTSLGEPAR